MRIPDIDTICASADRFLCRLFRKGGLRIVNLGKVEHEPSEATQLKEKPDRKAAIQTTNLILRELDPDRLRRKQMRDQ